MRVQGTILHHQNLKGLNVYVGEPNKAADMMSSTLVETVSINYEDFNDSFLTCGTCLCVYDSGEHHPKLLPCSHTVCKNCLERIVDTQIHDTGTFRCPICRETIGIPRGGVISFPPSFIVNQLLDLMSRQRRDVIPKCSTHASEELLFCESCDSVFCIQCSGEEHNGRGASEHTVIPFSIAIKRMSEILLYKAHLCIKNLNNAFDNVSTEVHQLENSVERTMENINRSFQDVISLVEKRRQECLGMVRKIREEKKIILKEQLDLIQAEKARVQTECDGLQFQVEVSNITKKISDLNEKLDSTSTLSEPRENSFLKYEFKHNSALNDITNALKCLGRIKVSTTFPALCSAKVGKAVTHLKSSVTISTVDYHGNPRTSGSDPVIADLRNDRGEPFEAKIKDRNDGSYDVQFVPPKSGSYKMCVAIFNRPIKGSPFVINVTDHNNPVMRFGSFGSGNDGFKQPLRVIAGDTNGNVFVLDTGNGRVKVMEASGGFVRHLGPDGFENQSGTGIAVAEDNQLVVVNWRTKHVSFISTQGEGEVLSKFTHECFVEPIDIAVNSKGEIIVADIGASKIFIFDRMGKLQTTFGNRGDKDGQFKNISAITVGRCDEILVADHRIQVFTKDGKFSRLVPNASKGEYCGIAVDQTGHILATRIEKGKGFVQVLNSSGKLVSCIDSFDDKLKRPSGLCVTKDHHLYVADLGNNCMKKYRYR
ncbi:tripartite motif-containing protein 2-like isoform X2 [Dreissena polymorpha]|uniref:tripartite motif-containing protein 2-like isoform X2 n=1 Tax=Dreissena polymorpha TaxID=45954 RepID=UPI0022651C01|nr:tripartite motif-containing protein 2-like isoform X2 [Dreissena polymorpha]